MKRRKLSKRVSKKIFKKGALRVHKKNSVRPMRGGFRM